MRLKFRWLGRVFAFYCFRVRSAYGLRSGERTHLLLMDFDSKSDLRKKTVAIDLKQRFPDAPKMMYDTEHGFHAIVFKRFTFRDALIEMVKTPFIDLHHVAIGLSRGYWFLETKKKIPRGLAQELARNGMVLHFMKIERGEVGKHA